MSETGGSPRQDGAAARDPAESAVRTVARSLLSFVETRTRIAASEFEEQLLRLVEVAVWAVAAMFLLGIGATLLSLFIVLVFWDSNRVLAAGLLAVLFLAGGGFSALMARTCLAARPKFLATTLAELGKDRERLQKP